MRVFYHNRPHPRKGEMRQEKAAAGEPATAFAYPCDRLAQAPSCMRQKRLTVIGAPTSFATPSRYFSTVRSPSAT